MKATLKYLKDDTLEVMEFLPLMSADNDIICMQYFDEDKKKFYQLDFWADGSVHIRDKQEYKDITESINPQSLTIVVEEECPECERKRLSYKTMGDTTLDWLTACKNEHLPNRKIEKETLIVFDKMKYEAEIIESLKENINKLIPIDTISKISREDLGNALAQINSLLNGLTPKEREIVKALKGE